MLSKFKKKYFFAVHMDDHAIKCAQIDYCHKTATYRLNYAAEFFLHAEGKYNNEMDKSEIIVKILKKLIPKKNYQILTKPRIFTALTETEIISKVFPLEEKNPDAATLESKVLAAAEKYLSINLETLNFDFTSLIQNVDENTILFVAAHQEKVNHRLSLFKKSSLNIKAIEGENYALARACLLFSPDLRQRLNEKSAIFIEIDTKSINFIIFKSLLPIGFYTENLDACHEINSVLSVLLAILPSIFATYPQLLIECVVVGGKNISEELITAISKHINAEFNLTLFEVKLERLQNFSNFSNEAFYADSLQWLRCFGLALRDIEDCDLNLLPAGERQRQTYQNYQKFFIFIFLFLLIGIIIWQKLGLQKTSPLKSFIPSSHTFTKPTSSLTKPKRDLDKNLKANILLSFPVSQMQLIGTLQSASDIFALVLTPKHQIFRLKIGDILGSNHGQIVNIEQGSVTIQEKIGQNSELQKITLAPKLLHPALKELN